MTRRVYLPLLFALGACGGNRRQAVDVLPETIGGWTRTSLRELPVSDAPDALSPNSVVRVRSAEYAGSGKLEVRAYELTNSTIGLDIAQRWHAAPDTVFFWAQQWFVVIHWQEADRNALQQFTTALEKRINGGSKR
jgi:hypothetical protein